MANDRVSEKKIFFLLFIFIWVYLWLRAICIPFAHDEVATFFYYVQPGRFLPFKAHMDVNNHFLNSALSWVSYRIFGSSPLSLRLPNLLFVPVLFYFVFKTGQEISNKFLRWAFMLTICLCQSFIEFFGISRGYGISMALLLGGSWQLLAYARTFRLHNAASALLLINLATFANLPLINTSVIFIAILFFLLLTLRNQAKFTRLKLSTIILFIGIIPLIFFTFILLELRKNGTLYAGSLKGFWEVTVSTVINLLAPSYQHLLAILVVLMAVFCVLVFFYHLFKNPTAAFLGEKSNIFFYLVAGNILCSVVLARFFKVNYPEDRIGLYFLPFLSGAFLFLADKFLGGRNKYFGLVLSLPFLFFPLQFIQRFNLGYFTYYVSDNIPQRFYDKVYAHYIPGKLPPTVGGEKGRHFCWTYLDFRNGGRLTQVFSSDYPGYLSDFIIAGLNSNPGWRNVYDSIDHDEYSGRDLLIRKRPVKMVQLYEKSGISSGGITGGDFFTLYETKTDSLINSPLCLSLDLQIESKSKPFTTWIAAVVTGNNGENIYYEKIPLDWVREKWSGDSGHLLSLMLIGRIPQNAVKLSVYVWNMNKAPYSIENGKLRLSRIIPDW